VEVEKIHIGWVFVWLGVVFVAWLTWMSVFEERVLPPDLPLVEDVEDRNEQLRLAYADTNPKNIPFEIRDFFDRLLVDWNQGGAEAWIGRWDIARFQEHAQDVTTNNAPMTSDLKTKLSLAIYQSCKDGLLMEKPEKIEVCHVDSRTSETKPVVYVLQRLSTGDAQPVRWWLERGSKGFHITDLEDPRIGVRLSKLLAGQAFLPITKAERESRDAAWKAFRAALDSHRLGQFEESKRHWTDSEKGPWFPPERVIWSCQRIAAAWHIRDIPSMRKCLNELDSIRPGTPVAMFWNAMIAAHESRWLAVKTEAERYASRFGPDRILVAIHAEALEKLGDPAGAKKLVEQALLRYPDDRQLLEILRETQP
jgi:hypothetical protein